MSRILVISPFDIFPPYWGAANRVYNLVKCLSNDNEVTLLYVNRQHLNMKSADDPRDNMGSLKVCRVGALTRYSQVLNPLLLLTGLSLIARERHSLIVAETAWSGLHAMILSALTRVPYVLDEHNVEFQAFTRMGRGGRLAIRMLKLYEKIACRLARRVICVSEQDEDVLASELDVRKNKIVLVPNGVDTNKFHPDSGMRDQMRESLGGSEGTPLILFFGKLDYKPNFEAVDIILNRVLPGVLNEFPDARFLVAGSNPRSDLSHENLVFVGVVDLIEDYINASDVVICPLTSGGGTRFKILEAIACGKNVVSTTIGAEGLDGRETEHCLTCVDDWSHFAQEVVRAIRNGASLESGEAFTQKYDWRHVTEPLRSQIIRRS